MFRNRFEGTVEWDQSSTVIESVYQHTLHQKISNEKNTNTSLLLVSIGSPNILCWSNKYLILVAAKLQLILQALAIRSSNSSSGDIISIEVIHNIHKDDHGQQSIVNLAAQMHFELIPFLASHLHDEFWWLDAPSSKLHRGVIKVCCAKFAIEVGVLR